MKKCLECKQTKPLSEFHKKTGAKDGKQSRCKVCNKARVKEWQRNNPGRHEAYWRERDSDREYMDRRLLEKRASKYGLTLDQARELLESTNGLCQICDQEPHCWLVIDHCHETLKVRGVLCEKCNQALGLFRDDPNILRNAIKYLGLRR